MSNIKVICDRCKATGIAGLADFSNLGDLLNFTAVPRQLKRRDGWTPVLQREFIARLAQTASPQLAVEAMGKCLHGVRKLLKDAGSDSFRAAWERAVELGESVEARRRIAEQAGIQGRAKHLTGSRLRDRYPEPDPVDPEEAEGMDDDGKLALLERLVAKFAAKVGQERQARLAGQVLAADFYLRQATCLEVAFDLMTEGAGLDGWQEIARARRGGHGILQIADTLMSRMLDDARRLQWERMGEPMRPENTPERYLTDHGTHRTAEPQHLGRASAPPPGADPDAWAEMDMEEQRQLVAAQNRADAEEQVRWEAASQAEAAEWRARQSPKEEKYT